MGALIAAGVITAAGAAAAGGMQMAAASKAAKAQGAAAKAAARKEKKALKGFQKGQAQIEADLGQIQGPVYDYAAMERDVLKESQFRRAQAFGDEAQYEALRKQALANISQGLAGQQTKIITITVTTANNNLITIATITILQHNNIITITVTTTNNNVITITTTIILLQQTKRLTKP